MTTSHNDQKRASGVRQILELYRPARCADLKGNFTWLLAMIISYPSVFIRPTLYLFWRLLQRRSLMAAANFGAALLHTLFSPLIVLYLVALPLVGCRLYAHTPGGQAIADIEAMMKAQDRQ